MNKKPFAEWSRSELIAKVKQLEKEVLEYIRAEQVLVAAGHVSETKVKQAHEIVLNFE